MKNIISILVAIIVFTGCVSLPKEQLSSEEFLNPPQSAQVHTWWHWISGNISKEGITKDLESMKQQGISEATILNIGSLVSPGLKEPEIKFSSPEWYEMFRFALDEANRLGITIGLHNCDGWSTSGGPWITPEQSMKQYVWTKTTVEGGQEINLKLDQPQAVQDFYRDYAIIAFPLETGRQAELEEKPVISLNGKDTKSILYDGNPTSILKVSRGNSININYPSEHTCNRAVLFPYVPFSWGNMNQIRNLFTLSYSNDGMKYIKVSDLEFVGSNTSIEVAFPGTKAKYFKLECLRSHQGNAIGELELLDDSTPPSYAPGISNLLQKTARVKAGEEAGTDYTPSTILDGIKETSVLDLSGFVSPEGVLQWDSPEGSWCVIRFGYTTTGITNNPSTQEGRGLECDKMDASALEMHFDNFSKRLISEAGDYTGNTFKFLLIDSWEAQFQNWTKDFPLEFEKRRGYSLLPWIPVLCGYQVNDAQLSEAFLFDFRMTIADLIEEKYYNRFGELCHENLLEMHAEVIYGFNGYPPLDIISSHQNVDMPMTEFWARHNEISFPEYTPANRPNPGFPTYSALTSDKQIIGSEAYTGYAHYGEAPADLKAFGDAAYCSGVNQMILHSYVHQPFDKKPGITLGPFGAHFNRHNPWWEYAADWMKYQARVQYILQKGKPVVDIVYYVGDQMPSAVSHDGVHNLPYGYRAFPCNFDMLKKAEVSRGQLSFGGSQSYPFLVLPDSKAMNYASLQCIAELINDGLVVLGSKPVELLSVSDIKNRKEEFSSLATELWGTASENSYGKGKVISDIPVDQLLKQLGIQPDFSNSADDPLELMWIHRTLGNTEVYFVFNQQKKTLKRELGFRVEGKTPEIWNAENGSIIHPDVFTHEEQHMIIPVTFKPNESKIFVFREGKAENVNCKQLDQSEKFEIENIVARLEFFPISDETFEVCNTTELKSLTEYDDPAIKYFAGKVKYSVSFEAPQNFVSSSDSLTLNLGNISATAKVILNGNLLGYAWMPQTTYNVSGILEAENVLEITVANVCRNRFIGDLVQYGEVQSLWTTSPIQNFLEKDSPLKPSGLMGPLMLTKYSKLLINNN